MSIVMRLFRLNCVSKTFRGVVHSQKMFYSYESDGKTTVSFLNEESDGHLLISAYNSVGFRLNSGLFVLGPVILFPRTILSWNVTVDDDINEDSLALFNNLEPKVDILVVGLSDTRNSFKNQSYFFNKILELRKSKLNFELLPTEKAVAAYNFLCSENRFVAAALIPPTEVTYTGDDIHSHGITYNWSGKDDYLFGDDCDEEKSVSTVAKSSSIEKHDKKRSI